MEVIEENSVLNLDEYTIDELRDLLIVKEKELDELEKLYEKKQYLVDGGIEFVKNIISFLDNDVQVSWKGTQANGVIKLMESLQEIKNKLQRGDTTECMLSAQTIYLVNMYLMNTVTTGYAAAVRVQRLYEPLLITFDRYQQDATAVNNHVELMNQIYRHVNELELENQMNGIKETIVDVEQVTEQI